MATEQKRNVQPAHDYDALAKVLSLLDGSGETAVLQVERANRRR